MSASHTQSVPLDTLISYKLNTGTTQVTRFNGKRSVLIQAEAAEGFSSGQAMTALTEVVHEIAPTGFDVEWSGQSREEQKASGSTGQVMALALIFVFLCLAALYESWSVPFSVLMTVPTGIFGALLSEYVLNLYTNIFGVGNPGFQNSIYMQIGVIMIMGLAAKNAILIVEFAKVRTDKGMETIKASLESAGLRLRPILMSTLTTVISLMPMAFFPGEGSASMQPISLTVFGGMTFGSVMTLFLMPTVYFIVNNRRLKKAAKKKAKKLAREEAKKGNVRKTRGKKFDVALTTTEGEEVRIATDGGEGDLNPEEKRLSTVHIEMQDEKPQAPSEAESTEEVKKPARKPRTRKQTEAQEHSEAVAEEPAAQKPKRTTRKRTTKPKAEDVAAAEEKSEEE